MFARKYPVSPPELNEFYGNLAIVTQLDDLWSLERLKTIVLFNLGAYDHLVEAPANADRGSARPRCPERRPGEIQQ